MIIFLVNLLNWIHSNWFHLIKRRQSSIQTLNWRFAKKKNSLLHSLHASSLPWRRPLDQHMEYVFFVKNVSSERKH